LPILNLERVDLGLNLIAKYVLIKNGMSINKKLGKIKNIIN